MTKPLARIPVGVVVERRMANSEWLDVIWLPIAVLAGRHDAAPWSVLARDADTAIFYAGPAEIDLYRSETDNYRDNLASGAPSIWVSLHATGGDPPYQIAAVTADPAEGESLTEPGSAIVEAVAMPDQVRRAIAAFVAQHQVPTAFDKRQRDRADPEAMARRAPVIGSDDERS
jgi:uncharacterized protein DUF3305